MSSIDERVVAMKFNGNQFLNGIKGALDGLSALKKGLNLDGAKKSLDEVASAGNRFSLGNMGTQIEGVNGKFLALATVAVAALTRITNAAITAGTNLVKSLTITPINDGLKEYETNLNAIQTILANTQSKGTTLNDVNGSLKELNEYSDKTIYNFSEMARNIGTFTAAGVSLEDSTSAIKGIANLAAVSGSNSQQASTAMYQLSQALSTGSVKLMDWNSVVNAGMGGELFQENIKETARNHGVAVDDIITKNGSFRDSLQEGWLSSEILLESLNKMTGDYTDEQLLSLGYSEEQVKGIQEMAKTASDAATKVKTMSQLIGTLQEAAGSGWAQSWQLIFGDFEQAKELFTNVNNTIGGMISASADRRNQILGDWNELGGRDVAIEAIANAFRALMAIMKPIQEAFRTIFPPMTGQRLFEITTAIRDFTEKLTLSNGAIRNIRSIFQGFFAVLDIGLMVLKGVAGVFVDVFSAIFSGSGTVLEVAGNVGRMLVAFRNAVKEGNGLKAFFDGVSGVLVRMVEGIKNFAGVLVGMFSGFDTSVPEASLDAIRSRLEPLGVLGRLITSVWSKVGGALTQAYTALLPLASKMSEFFGEVGTRITSALSNVDYSQALDTINTGLFAGLTLMITKFLKGDFAGGDEGGGLVDTIKDTFGAVTDTFSAMQASLKAGTLQKIAVAIGLITASVVALSFIDSAALTRALAGITVMIGQLVAGMALLDVAVKGGGFLKLPAIAAAMISLSVAVLILSAAVRTLSGLSWEELAKGLGGITVLLFALAGAGNLLAKSSGGLIRASVGMIALAVAVKILASAVRDFSELSWGEMIKGLVGLGAVLVGLAIFTKIVTVSKGALANSAGILILAVALKVLASALGDFATLSWDEIGRGLTAFGASLLILAIGLNLMNGTIAGSAALIIAAGALAILAPVFAQFGAMDWEAIGKAATVLAGALLIIAGGMFLMTAALPGAAALIVVAAALMILAPALVLLGSMSWGEIGAGLTILGAALGILAVAGVLLLPAIPGLLALGAAVLLIGAGAALAGIGITALAAGLTAMALAAGVGAVGIVAVGSALIGLIPALLAAVAQGILAMLNVLVSSAGQFLSAAVTLINMILLAILQTAPNIIATLKVLVLNLLNALQSMIPRFIQVATTIILSLLDAINKIGPRVISTLGNLVSKLVQEIARRVPEFTTRGVQMITAILNGIAANVGKMVTAATNIIVNFINGINNNMPRVLQAGVSLIINFVNSLANAIRNNQSAMNAAGVNLASAIVEGMASGIRGGLSIVTGAAATLARNALSAAKGVLGIKSPSREFYKIGMFSTKGMANGLKQTGGVVVREAQTIGKKSLQAMRTAMASKQFRDSVNINPVITPVMNLKDIRRKSRELKELVNTPDKTIAPTRSSGSAVAIANRREALAERTSQLRDRADAVQEKVTFVQNNYSPKALSQIDIYRRTKNQLSTVRR